jgi:hypothetical protein
MPKPVRVDPAAGREAVDRVLRALDDSATGDVDADDLKLAVRAVAARLQALAPGHSIEVRVPGPAGTAFQCGEGPRHTRGTPPNVVETDAITFVELAAGRSGWADAVRDGRVRASGLRADLSGLLPLLG